MQTFNLLAPYYSSQLKKRYRYYALIAVIASLILATSLIMHHNLTNKISNQLSLQNRLIKEFLQKASLKHSSLEKITTPIKNQIYSLQRLSHCIPNTAWLYQLDLTPTDITLQGQVKYFSDLVKIMAQFNKNLGAHQRNQLQYDANGKFIFHTKILRPAHA